MEGKNSEVHYTSFWAECHLTPNMKLPPISLPCPIYSYSCYLWRPDILCLLNYLLSAYPLACKQHKDKCSSSSVHLRAQSRTGIEKVWAQYVFVEWINTQLVRDFRFLVHTFLSFWLSSNELLLLLWWVKKIMNIIFFSHGNSTMKWHLDYNIWEWRSFTMKLTFF